MDDHLGVDQEDSKVPGHRDALHDVVGLDRCSRLSWLSSVAEQTPVGADAVVQPWSKQKAKVNKLLKVPPSRALEHLTMSPLSNHHPRFYEGYFKSSSSKKRLPKFQNLISSLVFTVEYFLQKVKL